MGQTTSASGTETTLRLRGTGERGLQISHVERETNRSAVSVQYEGDWLHPALGFAASSPNDLADWQRGLLDYYGEGAL